MAESKIFKLVPGVDCDSVGLAVEGFLRERKGLYVEGVKVPEGYFVQAKEPTTWKKFAGMDTSVQVRIIPTADMINVEVGTGKWIEKAGLATAGMIFFAPLAVTTAIGAWWQKKLPGEIFEQIEKFLMSGGQNVYVTMSPRQELTDDQCVCPQCKAINRKGQKFCSSCGSKLGAQCPHCLADIPFGVKFCPECGQLTQITYTCPSCGATLREGAKFCAECGTRV